MMLLFFGVLGLVIYLAVGSALKTALKSEPASAIEIIRTRYAKNEISAEEYKRMKDELACLPTKHGIPG